MKLWQYVGEHTNRGECKCGRCIDGKDDPKQPFGHTADLVFFEVTKTEDADVDTFANLVEAEFPHWLDGNEHSYIEMGADIGDQGMALSAMGLGTLLGLWDLLSPKGIGISDAMALQMAGMGALSIQVMKEKVPA